MHVRILYLKFSIEWYINKCIYKYIFLSDPPYTTAYNVTISSFLTPADLSGFDIIISWTVSDDSVMGHYVLLKALLPVCMKYTARGESRVATIARGEAECYICHETLTKSCILSYKLKDMLTEDIPLKFNTFNE